MSNQLPAIELLQDLRTGEAIKSFMEELEAVAEGCSVTSPFASVPTEQPAEPEVKTCGDLKAVAEMYSFASPKPRFYRTEDNLPASSKPHVNTHVSPPPAPHADYSYSYSHHQQPHNWFAPTELKHMFERRYRMLVSAIRNFGH
jgi:hypothetical protein